MSTLYLPRVRNEWFRDKRGVWTTSKDKDAVDNYDIDFFEQLDSGETLSTVTVDANGVTVNTSTIVSGIESTNTAVRLNISDTDGHVEVTVTTSGSRTLVRDVRFIAAPLPAAQKDYR